MNESSSMPCWEVREAVWPAPGPPPRGGGGEGDGGGARQDEAWDHVRRCPACRRWIRRDAELSRAAARADVAVPAPPALRRRIERSLDRGSARAAPRGRRAPALGRLRAAAAAAIVILAVSLEVWSGGGGRPDGFSAVLADDYLRHTREEVRLGVSDPEAISRFFARHVGSTLEPVRVPGAEIQGAMICWLEERPTAMIMYRLAGHHVAHYRARSGAGGTDAGEADGGVRTLERSGVRVAQWTRDGERHALVSDLDGERLGRLARTRFAAAGD